jgi:hypothetical protein
MLDFACKSGNEVFRFYGVDSESLYEVRTESAFPGRHSPRQQNKLLRQVCLTSVNSVLIQRNLVQAGHQVEFQHSGDRKLSRVTLGGTACNQLAHGRFPNFHQLARNQFEGGEDLPVVAEQNSQAGPNSFSDERIECVVWARGRIRAGIPC